MGQREECKSGFPYLLNTYEEILQELNSHSKDYHPLKQVTGEMEEHTVFGRGAGSRVHVPEKGVGWCEVNKERRLIPPKTRLMKAHRAKRCSIQMKTKRPYPIFRGK